MFLPISIEVFMFFPMKNYLFSSECESLSFQYNIVFLVEIKIFLPKGNNYVHFRQIKLQYLQFNQIDFSAVQISNEDAPKNFGAKMMVYA